MLDPANGGAVATLRPLAFIVSLQRALEAAEGCEALLVDVQASDDLKLKLAKFKLALADLQVQARSYNEPAVRPMATVVLAPAAGQELRSGLDAALTNARSFFGASAALGHSFCVSRPDGALVVLADVLLDDKVVWQSPVGIVGGDAWRWRSD